jgi:TPR repeat protein
MYANGQGVAKDVKQGLIWHRKAADQGHAEAQYKLGENYSYGSGISLDRADAEAARWYRRAADQGHVDAQYKLGEIHVYGRGVPRDHAEAASWYHKAADHGHGGAQSRLGFMYAIGRGVPKDEILGYAWASLSGTDEGRRTCSFLEQSLSDQALLLARQRTKEIEDEIKKRRKDLLMKRSAQRVAQMPDLI